MVLLVFCAGLSLSIEVPLDRNGKGWRQSLRPWGEAPQHSHTLCPPPPRLQEPVL